MTKKKWCKTCCLHKRKKMDNKMMHYLKTATNINSKVGIFLGNAIRDKMIFTVDWEMSTLNHFIILTKSFKTQCRTTKTNQKGLNFQWIKLVKHINFIQGCNVCSLVEAETCKLFCTIWKSRFSLQQLLKSSADDNDYSMTFFGKFPWRPLKKNHLVFSDFFQRKSIGR